LKQTEDQVNATEEKVKKFLQDPKLEIFKSNSQSHALDMNMDGGLQGRYQLVKPKQIKRFRRGMPIEDVLTEPPLQGPSYFPNKDSDKSLDIFIDKMALQKSPGNYSKDQSGDALLEKIGSGSKTNSKSKSPAIKRVQNFTGVSRYDR
jgi:hypothetical protein